MDNDFTLEQEKQIFVDYLNLQNFSEVARKYNTYINKVRRIVEKYNKKEEFVSICKAKKEQETNDLLAYMDKIEKRQEKIIDLSLEALEQKLSKLDKYTNVKDIATVYGVIFDKALKYREMQLKQMELSKSTNNIDNMETLADLLKIGK